MFWRSEINWRIPAISVSYDGRLTHGVGARQQRETVGRDMRAGHVARKMWRGVSRV